MKIPPLARVLPLNAARLLQLAAITEPSAADPLRRQKAIEKATQQIKRNHPEFFNIKELQNESET